jgi:hypothetical protein
MAVKAQFFLAGTEKSYYRNTLPAAGQAPEDGWLNFPH